jgi:hypothetical protein
MPWFSHLGPLQSLKVAIHLILLTLQSLLILLIILILGEELVATATAGSPRGRETREKRPETKYQRAEKKAVFPAHLLLSTLYPQEPLYPILSAAVILLSTSHNTALSQHHTTRLHHTVTTSANPCKHHFIAALHSIRLFTG